MTPPQPTGDGRRVRVLRIIARLNIGGPAIHATLLTERLDPARYDSLLVAGAEEAAEGNYLALHGKLLDDRVISLPALGRELRGAQDLRVLWQLVRLMRRVRPDIVHTHTAKAGALGRLAAWMTRAPVVVHTYHGHVFQGYFSRSRTRVFLAIERALARVTDRIITVSDAVRSDLLRLRIGSADRLVVVPLGLDLDRFARAESKAGELRAELGLDATTPLVGIVARLVPIKAHDTFLEAAASVVKELPRVRFIVVGDGERRAELEALARRLDLAHAVRFLGWRGDLDRVYADLDLVALSSLNEGSPVALIEAMAAGRAVVATAVGGVPDLVRDGEHGLLVAAGDAADLARQILLLLRDPARRREMGARGRRRVLGAFGADRLLADIDRLYQQLLAGAAAPGQRH